MWARNLDSCFNVSPPPSFAVSLSRAENALHCEVRDGNDVVSG